jgi:hypothetical protein
MDWIFFLLYRLYEWFTCLFWFCKRNVTYYYLVDEKGYQHLLNDETLPCYKTLLVIYYTPNCTRYRFHPVTGSYATSQQLRQTYSSYSEPEKYKLFAVNISIHDQVHTINALEFNIIGNELFTPVFKLWLCYNYLHVNPTTDFNVSYIDDDTVINTTKGPITFYENKMEVGQNSLDETDKSK